MRPLLVVVALLSAGVASAQAVKPSGTRLPAGVCVAGASCSPSGVVSSGTVTSQAASGQYSFQPTVANSRLGMGPGVNQWWACPDAAKCFTDSVLWLSGGVDMRNGTLGDSYAGAVRINATDGFAILLQGALPTCTSAFVYSGATHNVMPGTLFPEAGTAGKPTKLCICTYDGTNYRWYNLLNPSAATGTATTCPEYP